MGAEPIRPASAVTRHRWGWPAPVRRAVSLGLTATTLVFSATAGTSLGFATRADEPPPATPRWQAGFRGAAPVDPVAVAGPPTEVRIPRIDVRSTLVGLGLGAGGELTAPADFGTAGWYERGTLPGETGPAVIAGHVDSYRGPAVFYRLRELRPGDTVEVRRGGEWLPFRVVATARYPKDAFPTEAVYGATPRAELRLITCGGEFDRAKRSYRDNVVVYAVDDRAARLPESKGAGPRSW